MTITSVAQFLTVSQFNRSNSYPCITQLTEAITNYEIGIALSIDILSYFGYDNSDTFKAKNDSFKANRQLTKEAFNVFMADKTNENMIAYKEARTKRNEALRILNNHNNS